MCRYVHKMSTCSSRSVDSGVMEDQTRQLFSSMDTSYREESSLAEVRWEDRKTVMSVMSVMSDMSVML